MPIVQVNCIAIGSPDRGGMVGFIYRVEGFNYDILVKGLAGCFNNDIHWLFFQN
jgi:hypothetical protein